TAQTARIHRLFSKRFAISHIRYSVKPFSNRPILLEWPIRQASLYLRFAKMSVPKVAIVGRPNVGKSSIMNWLAHKRVSVVDPMAGVTRDRVTYLMHVDDRYFELIDTGGIGIVDVGELTDEVDTQIRIAIEQADVIMFVVEGPAGITALDQE